MRLSLFTDNSLKVLMYVATHTEQRCTRNEIAKYFDLSEEHLRKVIHQLNLLNYLNTFAGRNGGIELATDAKNIKLGDVIRNTEKQIAMFDCEGQNCRLLPSCSLNHVLYEAQQAFFNELEKHSLASLIKNKETWNLLKIIT